MTDIFWQSQGDEQLPALLLLHGWGMNSTIWQSWLPHLTPYFCVHTPDIPGLGRSSLPQAEYSLESAANSLLEEYQARMNQPAIWLGWSLGGLIALKAGFLNPKALRGLVTLATSPCFVMNADWQAGMSAETFRRFQQQLLDNPAKILLQFSGLMAQGESQPRELIRQVRQSVAKTALPAGLGRALNWLAADYRAEFNQLSIPHEYWFFEEDALVPLASSAALNDQSKVKCLPHLGHLAFLSQPKFCADQLLTFQRSLGAGHV